MAALPDTRRGGVTLRRALLRAGDGLFGLSQTFEGDGLRVIVTHDASLLAFVDVLAGTVAVPLVSGEVAAPSRFVMSLPPRTVLPMRFDGALVSSQGVASFSSIVAPTPALLRARDERVPLTMLDVREAAAERVIAVVDADASVPHHVVCARRALHAMLARPAPVREAARASGIAAETLTRAFQQAYAISPKQYVHRARLFGAVLRLLSGKAIVETALDTGFNDVTRFYAQFRRLIGVTPGVYASIRKRQDTDRSTEGCVESAR